MISTILINVVSLWLFFAIIQSFITTLKIWTSRDSTSRKIFFTLFIIPICLLIGPIEIFIEKKHDNV